MAKNIEIHMNSYAWLAKIVAEKMVTNNIKGSIINLNSIYGLLGQDLNIYEKTSMKENMPYSMIKGGLANLTRQMASYYGRFGVRVNKNYGYSFLPPSEWNLPLPDIKKCIPQKVCEPCPVFGLDSGAYLQVQGAKQLPPKAPTKSTV